jgi:hypothetical protein
MAEDPNKKKKKSIWARIGGAIKRTLEWIPEHLGDPALAREIREDLGLKPGEQIPEEKTAKFKQFAQGLDPDKESFAETVAEIGEVAAEIKVLAELLKSDEMPPEEIAYILFKLGVTDSVRMRFPAVYGISRGLLFLEEDYEALAMIDPSRLLRQLRGEDLPKGEELAQRLSFFGGLLLQLFDGLMNSKGDPEKDDPEKPGHVDVFYGWDLAPESVTPKADLLSMRTTTFSVGRADGTGGRLLASIMMVPTEHGGPGLFLAFGGVLTLDRIEGQTHFRLDAGFADAFDIFIPLGDEAMDLTASGGGTTPFLKMSIGSAKADFPSLRIGDPDKTRFDVYESEFGIDVRKDDAGVRAALRDAELVIVPGSSGFLRAIAGDGAKVRVNVGIVADSQGFRLDGGTKLSATLPVGRSIAGLLTVHHVEIALGPSSTGGDLGLELAGAFTATLGPFAAVVDRIGFQLDMDRREDANLGLFHVDPTFKSPSGIGLRLDAGIVKGGGYLYVDEANHEYNGALELEIGKWSIKAIGVLSERPDGGWSLLLFIYAQFPPQPIGFGFTLNGAGGLAGLQHGVDIVALSAGMKTKAFDDILFPVDPVGDAPRIINRLRTLFPLAPRALTIGLMVDLGWGTPRVIYIRLGIIVQADNVFGEGTGDFAVARILLVGQVKVAIGPTKQDPDQAIIRLIVDILGFWDWAVKRYGFLARLRDSRLGPVDVSGGLGVWGEYGEKSNFILTAGGFNPRFKDVPAEMTGATDRLTAGFKVGKAELKITGYFAITPASIQAGLDVSAKGKVGPVGFKGSIGFDVIVHQHDDRTHFIADFHVTFEVNFKGHTLGGVKVVGVLEGPDAWFIDAKITFSILWWDVSKHWIDAWGEEPPTSVVTTEVSTLIAAELANEANWSAQLPPGGQAMASLAPDRGELATLAHPLGRFVFSQRVAPLGLELSRFGAGRVSGPTRFEVTAVTVGRQQLTSPPRVREHFARAQFVEMSDEEKLTRPSFEELDAGVEFSSEAFHVPASTLAADMDFERTAYLDLDLRRYNQTRPAAPGLRHAAVDHSILGVLAAQGAAGRAPMRLEELMAARVGARVQVSAAPLVAVDRDALAPDPVAPLDGQARVAEMLADQRLAPGAQLVEEFELVGS